MVYKIKYLKLIAFAAIFFILCFSAFLINKPAEGNLLKTLLPQKVINSSDIIPIADKSSSVVKIVFEANDYSEAEKTKNEFIKNIDSEYFEVNKIDVSSLMENYLSHPENFLSYKTRELLKEKNYDVIYSNAIEQLYNPSGIQLTTTDKDPYLLFNDFLLSNAKMSEEINNSDDKYFDYISLSIKNNEGLSPDFSNKKIKELVEIQNKLSKDNSKIYLAGSPVHSYYTSLRAKLSINIICVLSSFLIIFLTYFYFKSIKPVFKIAISILFGMLTGFAAVNFWFDNFQIITMVFSTTLIGIGIDYSYHYFFSEKADKTFVKNLTYSLLTTIVPFILLYLTGIELLKQTAVFTVFGLCAIYFAVLFLYPCFDTVKPQNTLKIDYRYCKILFFILCAFSISGIFRFNFNDSLSALYTPSGKLLKAEKLYNTISKEEYKNTQIITVEEPDYEKRLEKEEDITDSLNEKSLDFIALSKIIPSQKRQKENFGYVKNLYNENLYKFSDILSDKQIKTLKNIKFEPVIYNEVSFPYLNNFLLGEEKSLIYVFSDQKLDIKNSFSKVINIKSDLENYMKNYRQKLIMLFPAVLIILSGFLSFIYNIKKAFKILMPPITGIIFALFINNLIFGEINLFGIITLFLILGFTMDYSIFRISGEEKSEDAILTSALTTSVSFLLLVFAGFKLLSTMAVILFFGIVTSYITGYLIFRKE